MTADRLEEKREYGVGALRKAESALCGTLRGSQAGPGNDSEASEHFSISHDASALLLDTRADPPKCFTIAANTSHRDVHREINVPEVLSLILPQTEEKISSHGDMGDTEDVGDATQVVGANTAPVQSGTNTKEDTSRAHLRDRQPGTTLETGGNNVAEPSKIPVLGPLPRSTGKTQRARQCRLQSPGNTPFPHAHLQDPQTSIPPLVARSETVYYDAVGFLDINESAGSLSQASVEADSHEGSGAWANEKASFQASVTLSPLQHHPSPECSLEKQDTHARAAPIPTSTNSEDASNAATSADGFLDRSAECDAMRICIPTSLEGETSPETPASVYHTPVEWFPSASPTLSDSTTLFDMSSASSTSSVKAVEADVIIPPKPSSCPIGELSPDEQRDVLQSSTEERVEERTSDRSDSPDSDVLSTHAMAPLDVPKADLEATPSQPLATAADIPPELFDIILDSIIWDLAEYRERRHFLETCSLVCRHWARRCRAWRFTYLKIRGEPGLQRLVDLLSAPRMEGLDPGLSFVRGLELVQQGSDAPWVHKVPALYDRHPDLARGVPLHLRLENYPTAGRRIPLRSAFFYLPRTPPNLYQSFRKLTLHCIEFAKAEHLFNLLREFLNLETAELFDVTARDPLPTASFPPSLPENLKCFILSRSRESKPNRKNIDAAILSAAVGFTPFSNGTRRARHVWDDQLLAIDANRTPWPSTDPKEVLTIQEIKSALSCADADTEEIEWSFTFSRNYDKFRFRRRGDIFFCAAAVGTDTLRNMTPYVKLLMEVPTETQSQRNPRAISSHFHLTRIVFDFRTIVLATKEEMMRYKWEQILEITMRLPFIEKAEFVFDDDQYRDFMAEAHAGLLERIMDRCSDIGQVLCQYHYTLTYPALSNNLNGDPTIISIS